jgi:hypothetical protein
LLSKNRIGIAREYHDAVIVQSLGPSYEWSVLKNGRGGRIRTFACWNQNPVP